MEQPLQRNENQKQVKEAVSDPAIKILVARMQSAKRISIADEERMSSKKIERAVFKKKKKPKPKTNKKTTIEERAQCTPKQKTSHLEEEEGWLCSDETEIAEGSSR